jgi:hypothetical protein
MRWWILGVVWVWVVAYILVVLNDHARGASPPAARAAVAVSRAYWGTPPCGNPRIRVIRTRRDSEWLSVMPSNVIGIASPQECLIEVMNRPRQVCRLIGHEWGHLMGKQHVDDPTDIMYPVLIDYWPPCDARNARVATASFRPYWRMPQ